MTVCLLMGRIQHDIMRQGVLKEDIELVFCWHLLLGQGPTLKCGLCTQRDSRGKNCLFSFLSGYQLEVVSGWGMGAWTHSQTMCRARDLRTLSPKWDVSIKSLPPELREPYRRGSRKNVRQSPTHCGWCHPWAGGLGFYKKASWASQGKQSSKQHPSMSM